MSKVNFLVNEEEVSSIFKEVFGHENFNIEYKNHPENWYGYYIKTKTFTIEICGYGWNHNLRLPKDKGVYDRIRYDFERTVQPNGKDIDKEYIKALFVYFKNHIDKTSLYIDKYIISFLNDIKEYK